MPAFDRAYITTFTSEHQIFVLAIYIFLQILVHKAFDCLHDVISDEVTMFEFKYTLKQLIMYTMITSLS